MSAKPYRPKGCAIWYIRYQRNGKRIVESSQSEKKTVAQNLLDARLGEIQQGTYIPQSDRKVTIADLYETLLHNYRSNNLSALKKAQQRWAYRLGEHFANVQALALSHKHIDSYVSQCQEEGLANATINRDLAILSRAFTLAVEDRRIPYAPKFRLLKEAPPRRGFIRQDEYDALAAAAKYLWLRALLAVAYNFGCRRGELLGLRVRQVDLVARVLRLEQTKNGEDRDAPMSQEVYLLLAACVEDKQPNDLVFTHADGRPVKSFRKRWANLLADAGIENGDLLFHDLRRSAVRNLIRSGVGDVVAMRISGHKTRAVFDRYNIVSHEDLVDAVRKLEAGVARDRAAYAEQEEKSQVAKKWLNQSVLKN